MSYHPAVPILDEAWMDNRRRWREWEARMNSMSFMFGSRLSVRDTEESLREDYATGRLSLETFERRLDEVLACA